MGFGPRVLAISFPPERSSQCGGIKTIVTSQWEDEGQKTWTPILVIRYELRASREFPSGAHGWRILVVGNLEGAKKKPAFRAGDQPIAQSANLDIEAVASRDCLSEKQRPEERKFTSWNALEDGYGMGNPGNGGYSIPKRGYVPVVRQVRGHHQTNHFHTYQETLFCRRIEERKTLG
jgi:hypothetical protein